MTDTVRNRSRVLAKFLRAAVQVIKQEDGAIVDAEEYDNAVQSIEAVAEELETDAARPDPAQTTNQRASS